MKTVMLVLLLVCFAAATVSAQYYYSGYPYAYGGVGHVATYGAYPAYGYAYNTGAYRYPAAYYLKK
jgi:hypothetical protein